MVNGRCTKDKSVHVINVGSAGDPGAWPWWWERLQPACSASYVYGASLTALEPSSAEDCSNNNNGVSVSHAVWFGGFQSG